jgi:hypothetical protein
VVLAEKEGGSFWSVEAGAAGGADDDRGANRKTGRNGRGGMVGECIELLGWIVVL